MRAVPVRDLLEPRTRGTPQYEVKFDGWRCVAFADQHRIYLQSRQGRDLTPYFPDVVAYLDAALLPDVVLDGELIIFDSAVGRTSFSALQRRVTSRAGAAASYVVFDLLQFDRHELVDRPLLERRLLLEELPGLTICPATRDPAEARRWFDDYAATGAEGLIIKDLTSRYGPRRPGWWKWRRRVTTEAVIGGVVGSPEALLLGRYSPEGTLRYVGRSVPLTRDQWAGLAPQLEPAGAEHPWPRPLPPGPFDQGRAVDYQPVAPLLVAEIAVDEAFEHGRWRHPVRYLRLRPELHPCDMALEVSPASPRPPA